MLSIDMQFMLDDMVPKVPDTMASLSACETAWWLDAFFPIFILFGAHILSFHE